MSGEVSLPLIITAPGHKEKKEKTTSKVRMLYSLRQANVKSLYDEARSVLCL